MSSVKETDSSNAKSTKKKSSGNPYLRFTAMAFQMGILIALGAWGGSELDTYLRLETPVFTLVFCLLAIGISLYLIIKEALKLGNEDN